MVESGPSSDRRPVRKRDISHGEIRMWCAAIRRLEKLVPIGTPATILPG
jgi:hypothetical protein